MRPRKSRRIVLDIDEILSDEDCASDDEAICVECTQCGKAFRVRVSGDSMSAYMAQTLGKTTSICPDCMEDTYGDDPTAMGVLP